MRYKTIEIHAADRVAVIWLNRPEVRNALDETLVAEVSSALERLESDADVGAVALAGRGPSFCGGIDLNWLKRLSGTSAQNKAAQHITALFHRLYSLRKPTVARVHGTSYAGGLGLISACDVAIATQDAEFCLSEVRVGLSATTIMPYVLRAIGERQVRRYVLSGERFSAAEAFRIGLVHDLARPEELDGAVDRMLGHLLAGIPAAQTSAKELAAQLSAQAITPALVAQTAARFAMSLGSAEAKAGIKALVAKRAAYKKKASV